MHDQHCSVKLLAFPLVENRPVENQNAQTATFNFQRQLFMSNQSSVKLEDGRWTSDARSSSHYSRVEQHNVNTTAYTSRLTCVNGDNPQMGILLMVLNCGLMSSVYLLIADTHPLSPSGIFENSRLTAFTVIGSTIGALLTIGIFPDSKVDTTRQLSLKFGCSLLSGIAFTPSTMYYLAIPSTSDLVIAVSALTAITAVSLIHKLMPKIESFLENKFPKQ